MNFNRDDPVLMESLKRHLKNSEQYSYDRKHGDDITVDGVKLEYETDNARYVSFATGIDSIWIPRLYVKYDLLESTITVPEWLAKEKNIWTTTHVMLMQETEKAYRFACHGKVKYAWVAKSCSLYDTGHQKITLPRWMARSNGMISRHVSQDDLNNAINGLKQKKEDAMPGFVPIPNSYCPSCNNSNTRSDYRPNNYKLLSTARCDSCGYQVTGYNQNQLDKRWNKKTKSKVKKSNIRSYLK